MIIELSEGERTVFERIIARIIENFMMCFCFNVAINRYVNIHGTNLTFSENTSGYRDGYSCSVNINGEWGVLNTSCIYKNEGFSVHLRDVKIEVSDEKPFSAERFSNWLAISKLMDGM